MMSTTPNPATAAPASNPIYGLRQGTPTAPRTIASVCAILHLTRYWRQHCLSPAAHCRHHDIANLADAHRHSMRRRN